MPRRAVTVSRTSSTLAKSFSLHSIAFSINNLDADLINLCNLNQRSEGSEDLTVLPIFGRIDDLSVLIEVLHPSWEKDARMI